MSELDWARLIGANVKAAREKAKLTQPELGRQAGMLVPNISRLENGAHLPNLKTLIKIAEALGVHPAALMKG